MSSTARAPVLAIAASAIALVLPAAALSRAPSMHPINAKVHLEWAGGRGGRSIFIGEVTGRPFPSVGMMDALFTPIWPLVEPNTVNVVYTLFFTNGSLRGVISNIDLTRTTAGPPDPNGPRRDITGTTTRIFGGTGAYNHAKGSATITGFLQPHFSFFTLKGSAKY
jgi:hypothetical protein